MEKLGIELPLLLTQIVNFTILLLVLTKLLYKPILKGLKDRQKKIEDSLVFAEKTKQEEEKLKIRQQEMLKETREESKILLEMARKDAQKQKEEIIEEGKHEAAQLKVKMQKDVESRLEEERSFLVGQTVDIAAEMTKRLLADVLTSDEQHQVIHKQLQKLEKSHAK